MDLEIENVGSAPIYDKTDVFYRLVSSDEKTKISFLTNADPRKWVCVEAEAVEVLLHIFHPCIDAGRIAGGIFVASIRDYDALLMQKPPYSPPYIHKTGKGQRVSFQTN